MTFVRAGKLCAISAENLRGAASEWRIEEYRRRREAIRPLEQRDILQDLLRPLHRKDGHDDIASRLEGGGEFAPQHFPSLGFALTRPDGVAVSRFDQGDV